MERAGPTPQVAPDTSDLADLGTVAGPFLTVQLSTEADIDNAAQRSEQRWRSIRDQAAVQAAPDEVLAAVDPLVADAHLEGHGLSVIANASGVLHVEHGPRPPARDLARWAQSMGPVRSTSMTWRQAS